MTAPVSNYYANMCIDVSDVAAIPTSILTATTYTSPIMPLFKGSPFIGALIGYGQVVVALKSTQVVTITIQRYLDPLGQIPVGAAATQATTANTAGYAATSAGIPALYWGFTIANASGSTATITNSGAMMLPNP
jgi:hypothetical protein